MSLLGRLCINAVVKPLILISLVNIETALLHRGGYILTFMSYVSPLFVLFSFRIFSLASVYPGGPFQLIYQTFHPYFCHKCYNTIPDNKYVAEVWQGSVFSLFQVKHVLFMIYWIHPAYSKNHNKCQDFGQLVTNSFIWKSNMWNCSLEIKER